MAKKKTIQGTDHLHSLTDPWGGINNTDHDIEVYGTIIPAGMEWGMNRDEVERFMKEQFGAKFGAFRSTEPDTNNFVHILCFNTEADAELYDSDPVTYGPGGASNKVLYDFTIPISTVTEDSYALAISTSRTGSSSASPIVVQRGATFNVPLRVLAWHYTTHGAGDAAQYNSQPSIVVEISSNGNEWTQVGTVNVSGIAESPEDESFPNIIDLGPMIADYDGALMVRFHIPNYVYTNAQGNVASMASNRVIIYVRTVTLGISMNSSEWLSPIRLTDGVGALPVRFMLQGNVAKTLHVQFTDTAGNVTYDVEVDNVSDVGEYNYSIVDDAGTLHVTDSGVHTLTAWLTYGSGEDAIETPHIVHQLLVLKGASASTVGPKVLIQQMAASVDNFVQSTLCHYWVWNPILQDGSYVNDTSAPVSVHFIVADTPNLSEEHTEYMRLPVSVTPGMDNTLMATMEIESADYHANYTARLHALANDGTAMLTPARQFTIDNTAGFQPAANSVFHMNPKVRDNTEDYAKTILNARNYNAVVESVWSDTFKMDNSDGWVQDSKGEKVLRVPAGRSIAIAYNPFNHFYTEPAQSKSLTIDIDFQVNNITNEDDPVFGICESTGAESHFLGLRLLPMVGTMGNVTDNNEATTDFRWAEGRRQHLAVTITPSVSPNANGDARYTSDYASSANGTINLVRVYLNGVIVRETRYNPANRSEFCTGVLSNLGIIIGQIGSEGRASGADIDIYGIRVWHSGLTPAQVLQNYVSALPSSDEKRRVKAHNDIIMDDNSGRISLAKATNAKKNCMIWHGVEVMIGDDKKKGWLEIRRYDYDGTYLPQYSGSFCKSCKKLSGKGQGTTAMTYFYWNIQWKFGDIGYDDQDRLDPAMCLILAPWQVNTDIVHLGAPVPMSELSASDQAIFELFDSSSYTHACPVYGGNLGKDEPVGTSTKYYPCTVTAGGDLSLVALPDGWVNGTGDLVTADNPNGGLYCGQCWQAGKDLPFGSKHVLKINYASSMQSHLIGVNWLYNALHKEYCGSNSLQRDTPTAVVAKQVVPVLFFTADVNTTSTDLTNNTASFRGLGGFGPGKMDKPSWGYSKKASKITDPTSEHYRPNGHDYFAMFEGAVNNSVLSDQIAPWDDTDHLDGNGNVIQRAKVKYFLQDPSNPGVAKDPESFYYRKTQLVSTEVEGQTVVTEVDAWEKGIGFDGGKTGRSASDGLLYNSNSCDNPAEAPSAAITGVLRNAWNYIYMHNPNIRYFQGTQAQLEAATLTEAQMKRKWITRDSFLLKRYDFCERRWVDAGLWNTETHAYDPIDIFEAIGSPAGIQDDRQAVVNAYITHIVDEARPSDNNETNGIGAYFNAKSLRFHYAFENHFIAGTDNCSKNTYYVIDPVTHLIELHQDDVDTTLATDNFGFQSKPYYVDRMNPYDDKDTVMAENESCYDGMLNTLFDLTEAMWADNGAIANALGTILEKMSGLLGGIGSSESENEGGVWRSLNRYLFDIQRYFPQVTFNETARIRYEFPAMLGFIGRGGEADPLAQSMGDQLEAEIQFMKRRLIYMASYAGFGDFAANVGSSTGRTGIADAASTLAVNSVALPNGEAPDQTFTVTPHQYLFPVFTWQSQTYATRRRTAPGEAVTITTSFGFANTYPIELRGLNYFRSVGNIGDKTINQNSFNLQGTRLTEFIAEPTTYYSTTQGGGSVTAEEYAALSDEEKAGYAPAFSKATNLQIDSSSNGATRLRSLSLKGCVNTGSTKLVPFDLSRLTLIESIDLRQTGFVAVNIPATATLQTLHLPASIATLTLTAQPNLATLDLENYAALESLTITGSPIVNTQTILESAHLAQQNNSVLAHVTLSNIDWHSFEIDALMWMTTIEDMNINGSIDILEPNSSRSVVTFDRKVAILQKWGNVDQQDSIDHRGLLLIYHKLNITGGYVTGNFYPNMGDVFQFGITPEPNTYANNFTKIIFSLERISGLSEASITENGVLTASFVSESQSKFRVTATITKWEGDTPQFVEVYRDIDLYNRQAEPGDYVYHDGTFSSDDNYDGQKKLIGICFYCAPKDSDGNIETQLFNPDDRHKRLMVALNDVDDQGFNTWQWGCFFNNSADYDSYNLAYFTDDQSRRPVSVIDVDGNVILTAGTASSPGTLYNVPSIVDISTSGLSGGSTTYVQDSNTRDEESTLGLNNYGFKPISPTTGLGDGVMGGITGEYAESGAYLSARKLAPTNNILSPTTSSPAPLQLVGPGWDYQEDDIVNSGYAKTLKLIEHRNKVIGNGIVVDEDGNGDPIRLGPYPVPQAGENRTELQHLHQLILAVREDARAFYEEGSNPAVTRYSQILYPAASAAYAYEPECEGFELNEKFKAHNWFLPTSGHLARLYWYQSKGTTGTASDKNIFKNAINRRVYTIMNTNSSAGTLYYWSSTEYSTGSARTIRASDGPFTYNGKYLSYRVRAVAAF